MTDPSAVGVLKENGLGMANSYRVNSKTYQPDKTHLPPTCEHCKAVGHTEVSRIAP